MRFDHIDGFNTACANVAELATKAIAEHRRQLEELATITREVERIAVKNSKVLEATRLADKPSKAETLSSMRTPAAAPAPTGSANDQPASEPTPAPKPAESLSDFLARAVQPAEPSPDLQRFEALQRRRASEFAPRASSTGKPIDPAVNDDLPPDTDNPTLAPGREIVGSLKRRPR